MDKDLLISDTIQQEGIRICESVQKGIKTSAYSQGRISPDQEMALFDFHNMIRKSYSEKLKISKI